MASTSRKRLRLDPSASPSPSSSPTTGPNELKRLGDHDPTAAIVEGGGAEKASAGAAPGVDDEHGDSEDADHCVICLHTIRDRTILPNCVHDRLCFDCIFIWCQQSRKCPLCNAAIGPYLIHHFRSEFDYSKYYLQPLQVKSPATGDTPAPIAPHRGGGARTRQHRFRWGPRRRNASASRERRDDLEIAISRRRWIYRNKLFAKHIASNAYTRYRPAPTPAQIAASPDLISRATIFIRRELRVWINLDVEFLTTFILSLMKSLDIRSESAIKLLAEFLDMDTPYFVGDPESGSTGRFSNAEQFAHELYSYLRSPFRDLAAYDAAVQYDTGVPLVPRSDPPPPVWDSYVPSNVERQSRRRSRAHPPPSPIYHSPRDAYSRSPSPANSDAYDGLYDREQSRSILLENSRSLSARDVKGKGKAPSRRISDTREPLRDESRHARRLHDDKRSIPATRGSPVPSPASHEAPSNARPATRSNEAGYSLKHERAARESDSRPGDPSPSSLASPTSNTQGNHLPEDYYSPTTADSRLLDKLAETLNSANHRGSEAAPSGVAWGISIKGQAKLLDCRRDVAKQEAPPHNYHQALAAADDESAVRNCVVPQKRLRNPSLSHKTQRAQGPSSARIHLSEKEGASQVAAKPSGNNASDRKVSDSSPSNIDRTFSAQDIMARTRTRLAKLRAESSDQKPLLVDVVPAAKLADTPTELPVSASSTMNIDLRRRLEERLDQEKRRATEMDDSPRYARSTSASRASASAANAANAVTDDETVDTIPNSHQIEKQLRIQALLRVRLAAEKKKIDVPSQGSSP